MSYDNIDDMLFGGGTPWAKFPTPGSSVTGVIDSTTVRQSREFGTGKPAVYDNGDPKQEAVIYLITDERDPDVAGDTGRRQLVLASKARRSALRDAVLAAGAKGLTPGSTITMTRGKDDAAGRQTFTAEYVPAPAGADVLAALGATEVTDAPF